MLSTSLSCCASLGASLAEMKPSRGTAPRGGAPGARVPPARPSRYDSRCGASLRGGRSWGGQHFQGLQALNWWWPGGPVNCWLGNALSR